MAELVVLRRYWSPEAALLAEGYLRAHGVTAMALDVDYPRVEPWLHFAISSRLAVPEPEVDAARQLLAEADARQTTLEKEGDAEPCPKCGGRGERPRGNYTVAALALACSLPPFTSPTNKMACAHCRFRRSGNQMRQQLIFLLCVLIFFLGAPLALDLTSYGLFSRIPYFGLFFWAMYTTAMAVHAALVWSARSSASRMSPSE